LIYFQTAVYSNNDSLTNEVLLELNSVFGPTFGTALDLIDYGAVTEIQAETSKRTLYQVRGTTGITYIVMPSSWRCPCPAWMYQTWLKNDRITCKHVLATRICQAMAAVKPDCPHLKKLIVGEQTFIQMLANMD
jgi:hypothetical protein